MNNRIVKNEFGDVFYYVNNELHREDGPAIEYINGQKIWLQNDKIHRLGGPAYEGIDKIWYYQGEVVPCNSQEEFEKIIKLKAFW